MKPVWDKLMEEYEGSEGVGIYDVDCTRDGKSLCEELEVIGYPTFKYGQASNRKELTNYRYPGPNYEAIKQFTVSILGHPGICNPAKPETCSEETRKKVEELMALTMPELQGEITKTQKEVFNSPRELGIKRSDLNSSLAQVEREWQHHSEELKVQKQAKDKLSRSKKATDKQKENIAKVDKRLKDKGKDLKTRRRNLEEEKRQLETEQKNLDVELPKAEQYLQLLRKVEKLRVKRGKHQEL